MVFQPALWWPSPRGVLRMTRPFWVLWHWVLPQAMKVLCEIFRVATTDAFCLSKHKNHFDKYMVMLIFGILWVIFSIMSIHIRYLIIVLANQIKLTFYYVPLSCVDIISRIEYIKHPYLDWLRKHIRRGKSKVLLLVCLSVSAELQGEVERISHSFSHGLLTFGVRTEWAWDFNGMSDV